MQRMWYAGQPPVPLPLAVKQVPGWGGETRTTGCGGHSRVGPPPTVHNTWQCPQAGQSIQVSRTDDGTRRRQCPGHLCPAPEGTCYLARDGKVLWGENTSPTVAAKFYLAVVQAVLLYGSKTWVISPQAMAQLEGFHIRATWHMAQRHKPQQGPWKEWIYPKSEDVLKECGMMTIAEYVHIHRQTIVVYVSTRPILQKCRQGEQQRGAVPHPWWWEQPMDLDVPDAP
jgi:hypothetical protein